jgi:hypothetical protein
MDKSLSLNANKQGIILKSFPSFSTDEDSYWLFLPIPISISSKYKMCDRHIPVPAVPHFLQLPLDMMLQETHR